MSHATNIFCLFVMKRTLVFTTSTGAETAADYSAAYPVMANVTQVTATTLIVANVNGLATLPFVALELSVQSSDRRYDDTIVSDSNTALRTLHQIFPVQFSDATSAYFVLPAAATVPNPQYVERLDRVRVTLRDPTGALLDLSGAPAPAATVLLDVTFDGLRTG